MSGSKVHGQYCEKVSEEKRCFSVLHGGDASGIASFLAYYFQRLSKK